MTFFPLSEGAGVVAMVVSTVTSVAVVPEVVSEVSRTGLVNEGLSPSSSRSSLLSLSLSLVFVNILHDDRSKTDDISNATAALLLMVYPP